MNAPTGTIATLRFSDLMSGDLAELDGLVDDLRSDNPDSALAAFLEHVAAQLRAGHTVILAGHAPNPPGKFVLRA